MDIRPLTVGNALAVAELWMAGALESAETDPAFRPGISLDACRDSVAADLESGRLIGWAAFDAADRLLGYLTAQPVGPSPHFQQAGHLYLFDLDVRAESRRQGVATALVRQARLHARASGLSTIEVSWLSLDGRASGFWRKQGFVPYLSRARGSVDHSAAPQS